MAENVIMKQILTKLIISLRKTDDQLPGVINSKLNTN